MVMLFMSLKPKEASTISKDNIVIEGINVKCLQVLQPLLLEMEERNETLDVDEFVESCMVLYKSLDVG